MRIHHHSVLMLGAVLVAAMLFGAFPAESTLAQGGESCAQMAHRAFSELGTNCANLTRGSLCYGFTGVSATFSPALVFDAPGDRADLSRLQSVRTEGMDTATGTWGIAALSIQADLPVGLDEAVSLLLIGDGSLEDAVDPAVALPVVEPVAVVTVGPSNLRSAPGLNAYIAETVPAGTRLLADGLSPDGGWVRVAAASGAAWIERLGLEEADLSDLPAIARGSLTPFQAFTFQTGEPVTDCLEAPPPVLVVQGPEGIPVEIIANGTPIRIESTIFLRTLPGNLLELVVGMGRAILYPGTPDALTIDVGTRIVAPLGADGLVSGAWSGWRLLTQTELDALLALENIPPNVWNYPYVNPKIIQPSGVGSPSPIVQTPGGVVIPAAPPACAFPSLVWTPRAGEELPHPDWEALSLAESGGLEGILFQSDTGCVWDVFHLGPDGVANNVSGGPDGSDLQATASPDGQWVAFASNRADNWEIWISAITGEPQFRLTYNTAPDINPVWGPDGRLIFESSRDGNWDLFLVDVTGDGEPVPLTDDPGSDINAAWAPDGQSIFFQSNRDGDWELYRLNLDDGSLERLTNNDLEDQMPVISHDGTQMAWLQRNPYGVAQVMLMTLATRETRQMTDTGTDIGGHLFSPDDSFLVYHTFVGGSYEVFAIEIASGAIKNISNSPASDDRAPSFSAGSPVVIFQSDRLAGPEHPGQHELFEVDPLPISGPALAPVLLFNNPLSDDQFPSGADRDERNTSTEQALLRSEK